MSHISLHSTGFDLIYWGLMSFSTHCRGHIMMDSFKDKTNQYIHIGQDSAL